MQTSEQSRDALKSPQRLQGAWSRLADTESVSCRTGAACCLQLQSLTRLSLQDCGCSSFHGLLSHLPSLQELALPFNKLTSLQGLDNAAEGNRLLVLDVSHNSISAWDSTWLAGCSALTSLDLACNSITQPADLQTLSW
jgi:Leucine-rich repeat (LRR) protein